MAKTKISLELKADTKEHLEIMLQDIQKSLKHVETFSECDYVWKDCWYRLEIDKGGL